MKNPNCKKNILPFWLTFILAFSIDNKFNKINLSSSQMMKRQKQSFDQSSYNNIKKKEEFITNISNNLNNFNKRELIEIKNTILK